MEKVRGFDISYCQPNFPYEKVKNDGFKFLIIRAGIGKKTKDSLYDKHLKAIKQYKFDWGVYWYCLAHSEEDARIEAKKCIEVLNNELPTYPVFYDMEDNSLLSESKETHTKIFKAFAEVMNEAGYPVGLYANPSWLETYLNKNEIVGKYDIWLAHWVSEKSCAQYGQNVWQYGIYKLSGYGDVDGDYCYVDYPTITKQFYKNHNKKQPVDNTPKPSTPSTTDIKKGDKVKVKDGAKDYNGVGLATFVYKTTFDVLETPVKDRVVIGLNGQVTAAVAAQNLTKVNNTTPSTETTPSPALKKGDKVKVKKGAKDYNGNSLASFVYDTIYTILETPVKDRVVIGLNGQVTAAVAAQNLIKT